MAILVSNKVTKRFGGLEAVSKVDLEIKEHAIYSIIGPNGAGKTTFFNCVTGFYTPEEGEVIFKDRNITGLSPDRVTRLGISRTYQNIRLFKNMTAVENILVGMQPHLKSGLLGGIFRDRGTNREEKGAVEEANRLLYFINLKGKGDLLAKNLPYGEQRRLEIGRALASKPSLLLLDEPTAGMNPSETQDMVNFIRRLRDELGITVLLIEHQMRVVMSISEQISVLDFGVKIAEGTPLEIQKNPHVVEAYLGRGAASGLGQAQTAD
jgi:branched-chain amino acid transport system ATP-binding protein